MTWQRPLIVVIVIGLTALLVALLGSPPAPAVAAGESGAGTSPAGADRSSAVAADVPSHGR